MRETFCICEGELGRRPVYILYILNLCSRECAKTSRIVGGLWVGYGWAMGGLCVGYAWAPRGALGGGRWQWGGPNGPNRGDFAGYLFIFLLDWEILSFPRVLGVAHLRGSGFENQITSSRKTAQKFNHVDG